MLIIVIGIALRPDNHTASNQMSNLLLHENPSYVGYYNTYAVNMYIV